MGRIITLALKDLRILTRSKANIFWIIGFPLLMALFFGMIYSGGGGSLSGMSVAAVNEDGSGYAADYIRELDGMSALSVTELPRDSAFEKVRQGKMSAAIVIRKGFGEARGIFTTEPLVEVGIDPSRRMESGYLRGLLTQANFSLLQKKYGSIESLQTQLDSAINDTTIFSGVDSDSRELLQSVLGNFKSLTNKLEEESKGDSAVAAKTASFEPFAIEMTPVTRDRIGPRTAYEITFPTSLLWALIGCSATFGVSIVRERTRGTFLRLRLAPISRAHILAGKGLACFIACITVCILLMTIGAVGFGVRVGDPLMMALALVSVAFCFVGISIMVSVMGKTEESVGGASWAVLLVASMIGGGMIPLMMMPRWLLTVSHISPVKWGILAIEGGIWRGFTFSDMMLPVGMLLLMGSLFFIIGVTVLSRFDK